MMRTNGHSGVSLRELLPDAQLYGAKDIRIQSCCGEARLVKPGDLFVAIVGEEDDGHDYVRQAIECGASAVLAERLLPISLPQCLVPNAHEAFGRICQALAGSPCDQLRTVGITGSNGKTVTSMLMASIFTAAKQGVGILSSLGYTDGEKTANASTTTPSATMFADWLARTMANGCENAVIEISSTALAQQRTAGMEFDAAVLTNLRSDHVNEHGSVLNLRAIKGRLFSQLKSSGFVVLNADDAGSSYFARHLTQPTITVGMRERAEVMAEVIERCASEQTFLLTAGKETIPVRSTMIGDHHVYNCLSAAAVGLVLGIDLATIVRGLEAVDYVPGRLERVECGQPFSVFVDSARTPDSLSASLRAVKQVTRGRVLCVFGANGGGEQVERAQLGQIVERFANYSVITNQNPQEDEPLQIVHDILDGYDSPEKAHVMPDRAAAIAWALSKARPGDSVVIAGKGDEAFQHVGRRKLVWSDREVARDWLYNTANQNPTSPAPHGLRVVG